MQGTTATGTEQAPPVRLPPVEGEQVEAEVARLLELARVHLGMDVAFLGRFDDQQRTIAVVAAEDSATRTRLTGVSAPREETYCELIANGTLDPVTRDTATVGLLARLNVTHALRIGSYVGVPVLEPDGSVWGTVCGYTHDTAPHLVEADAGALRFIADLISTRIAAMGEAEIERRRAARTIDGLLSAGAPTMVAQPIVDLEDAEVVGHEALARFPAGAPRDVFELAMLGQRSTELELAAIGRAASALTELDGDTWLSCNVSLATATTEGFASLLEGLPREATERLVLEVTEHERHEDEPAAASSLALTRRLGARIAMDDIGAGWSGLERALRIEPEILKLDRALITGVHGDRNKQALVLAITAFADAVGATTVAEGIELAEEHHALRDLGVPLGQGWHLGRPTPLRTADDE